MPQPAARQNDPVTGTDIHILMVPSPGGPVPTPTPLPYAGQLALSLSTDVLINSRPAATQGSKSQQTPHIPPFPFQRPPTNQGTVLMGSTTVFIDGKPAARMGDSVMNCNDPVPAPTGTIAGGSTTVLIG